MTSSRSRSRGGLGGNQKLLTVLMVALCLGFFVLESEGKRPSRGRDDDDDDNEKDNERPSRPQRLRPGNRPGELFNGLGDPDSSAQGLSNQFLGAQGQSLLGGGGLTNLGGGAFANQQSLSGLGQLGGLGYGQQQGLLGGNNLQAALYQQQLSGQGLGGLGGLGGAIGNPYAFQGGLGGLGGGFGLGGLGGGLGGFGLGLQGQYSGLVGQGQGLSPSYLDPYGQLSGGLYGNPYLTGGLGGINPLLSGGRGFLGSNPILTQTLLNPYSNPLAAAGYNTGLAGQRGTGYPFSNRFGIGQGRTGSRLNGNGNSNQDE